MKEIRDFVLRRSLKVINVKKSVVIGFEDGENAITLSAVRYNGLLLLLFFSFWCITNRNLFVLFSEIFGQLAKEQPNNQTK